MYETARLRERRFIRHLLTEEYAIREATLRSELADAEEAVEQLTREHVGVLGLVERFDIESYPDSSAK